MNSIDSIIEIDRKRLELYYSRVCDALDQGNRTEALANLAELDFISRRLWEFLSK